MPLPNPTFNITPYSLLMPVGAAVQRIDPTNFNDPNFGSSWSYKVEDVSRLRTPTVRRIGIIYRDLGAVTITLTLTGSNDLGAQVSATTTATFGGNNDSKFYVTFADLTLTAALFQLTISRAAAGGPLAITSVSIIGESEEVTL